MFLAARYNVETTGINARMYIVQTRRVIRAWCFLTDCDLLVTIQMKLNRQFEKWFLNWDSFGFSEQQHINMYNQHTMPRYKNKNKIDNQHNLKEQKEGAEFLSKVFIIIYFNHTCFLLYLSYSYVWRTNQIF